MNDEQRQEEVTGIKEFTDCFISEGKNYGVNPTLRYCMELADNHGDIRVHDEAGAEYRFGSAVYERIFLLVLKDLVVGGCIEPVFENESQQAAWQSWINGKSDGSDAPGEIVDVPLRDCKCQESEEVDDQDFEVARAGRHLLEILTAEGSVRFHRFYDDTIETEKKLNALFGLDGDGWSAGLVMDLAVDQLRAKKVVATKELPVELSDGTNDYLIELTEEGRAFLTSGQKFRFHRVSQY